MPEMVHFSPIHIYISAFFSIFLDLRTPAIYPTGWQYHCQERSGHAEVMSKLDSTTNQAEAPNGERKGITHQTGRDGRRCQLGQWAFPKDTPTLEIAGIRIFWASLWLSVFLLEHVQKCIFLVDRWESWWTHATDCASFCTIVCLFDNNVLFWPAMFSLMPHTLKLFVYK